MVRFGVLTDSHGLDNIGVIAEAMHIQGVKKAIHLGDIAYETATNHTIHEANMAAQQQIRIAQESTQKHKRALRDDVLEGLFSDKQLFKLKNHHETGIEISDKALNDDMEYVDETFQKHGVPLEVVLGGNHDRLKPISDVFKDRFLNGKTKQIDGINIMGLSGGGSQYPAKNIQKGLMADDQFREIRAARHWSGVSREEDLDILLSHVPPTDGIGEFMENSVESLKNLLLERASRAIDLPKAILSGHRHGPTLVEFNKELGTLWIQPGVSALNHNDGQHASYVVLDINENTKEVKTVEEYRVHNFGDKTQEVELYAIHRVDYKNERISKEIIGRTIYEGTKISDIENHLSLDPTSKEKFNPLYEKLSAEEKDKRVRLNLAIGRYEAEKAGEQVRMIANGERRRFFKKRKKTDLFTAEDSNELSDNVFEGLFKYALEMEKGFDFDALIADMKKKLVVKTDEDIEEVKDIVTRIVLGHDRHQVRKSLASPLITFGEVPYDYVNRLSKGIEDKINQRKQKLALQNLDGKDFQEMAELYMPSNAVRTTNIISKKEGINLWAHTYQQGLFSTYDLLDNENYRLGPRKGTARKPEELTDKFGVDQINNPNPRDMIGERRLKTKEALDEKVKQVEEYLKGDKPVYALPSGQQFMDRGDGQNDFITDPAVQKKIGYEPADLSKVFIKDENGRYDLDRERFETDQENGTAYLRLDDGSKIDFRSFQSAMQQEEENRRKQAYYEELQRNAMIQQGYGREEKQDSLTGRDNNNLL